MGTARLSIVKLISKLVTYNNPELTEAILNSNSADSSTSSDSSVSDVDGTRLKRRDIYWHYTFALDRKNIETVVASVKDKILKYMLESMRL